jgi:hypothetical protein
MSPSAAVAVRLHDSRRRVTQITHLTGIIVPAVYVPVWVVKRFLTDAGSEFASVVHGGACGKIDIHAIYWMHTLVHGHVCVCVLLQHVGCERWMLCSLFCSVMAFGCN